MRKGTLSTVHDNVDPRRSEHTTLIGAALAAGAEFSGKRSLNDSIDEEGVREVSWSMNGDKLLSFEPSFESEKIDFAEFRRRFESLEWCEANPHHPISFLRAYRVKMAALNSQLRNMKPAARVKRGKKTALIPHDTTPERRAMILAEL